MSYDLAFWKQTPTTQTEPQVTFERLLNEERVEGLDELLIERILARIAEVFAVGWERLDKYNWERDDGSFQVGVGSQYFLIFSYSLPGEVLNEFIDIATEFGCKLYDPQTMERYEG